MSNIKQLPDDAHIGVTGSAVIQIGKFTRDPNVARDFLETAFTLARQQGLHCISAKHICAVHSEVVRRQNTINRRQNALDENGEPFTLSQRVMDIVSGGVK